MVPLSVMGSRVGMRECDCPAVSALRARTELSRPRLGCTLLLRAAMRQRWHSRWAVRRAARLWTSPPTWTASARPRCTPSFTRVASRFLKPTLAQRGWRVRACVCAGGHPTPAAPSRLARRRHVHAAAVATVGALQADAGLRECALLLLEAGADATKLNARGECAMALLQESSAREPDSVRGRLYQAVRLGLAAGPCCGCRKLAVRSKPLRCAGCGVACYCSR